MSYDTNDMIRGQELYVSVRGSSPVPLLFIHGCASDSSFFHESAELLSDRYTVVEYDRRGYRNSQKPADNDYSVQAQAEDAAGILRRFVPNRPAWVIAHSGGACIALELAITAPELLLGMILVEPALAFDADVRQKTSEWFSRMQSFRDRKKLTQALISFIDFTGLQPASGSSGNLQRLAQSYDNVGTFLSGELDAIHHYAPDEAHLRALSIPVAVVASELGAQRPCGLAAVSLSSTFYWPLYHMPGYHNAPEQYPKEFSELTVQILHDSERRT